MSEGYGTLSFMPNIRHEAAIRLFHDSPGFTAFLVTSRGVPVPAGKAVPGDSNLSVPDIGLAQASKTGIERRADVVMVTAGSTGEVQHVVVGEVQCDPPKQRKWWDWISYVGLAGGRYLRPVTLLVVALSDATARACRHRFETGHPGFALSLVLVTKQTTPHPDSPGAEPFAIQLTMLCILNQKFSLADPDTRNYILARLAQAPEDIREDYTRIIYRLAKPTDRKALEETVQTKYPVPFLDNAIEKGMAQGIEKGMAQGMAQGAADTLLLVLDERFDVPENVRDTVNACRDIDQIKNWTRQALTAKTIEDIFARD
jgi:hypothetical protein